MKASLLRLALLATVMFPAASALAADLDVPPPVDDLRPATYDWTGVHVGGFGGGIFTEGHYDVTRFCLIGPGGVCGSYDPELSGNGWQGGVTLGANYQVDSFVFGVEGDWGFGHKVANNTEPAERTRLDIDNFATLRARAGYTFDRTMFYATGGVAFAETELSSDDAPTTSGLSVSDSQWVTGWVVGGGIEHAFTDSLSGKLEYMYLVLPDTDYHLENSAVRGDVTQTWDNAHIIRAGLNWNFSL
jgi:outer membrane immunogenic protein